MRATRHGVVLPACVTIAGTCILASTLWAQTMPASDVPARRVRPQASTPTCTGAGCHDDLTKRPFTHGPVAQHKCQACHAELEPRQHTFRDAMPRQRMCSSCHLQTVRDVVHAPFGVGDCTGCHDPHGSKHRLMLRADPATALCLTCHEDLGFRHKKFVHGPVSAGACILCHEPHTSWHVSLLKRKPDELCAGCHAGVKQETVSLRHVHPPARDGRCVECHDPHASNYRGQLKADGAALCTTCHEPLGEMLKTRPFVHGAVTSTEGCAGCHVGHASNAPGLLRAAQPDSCLTCHDRELKDAAGKPITNMKALLANNPQHHGPIRDGNCTACHDPHASKQFRLLVTEYPPDFYAPYDEQRYRLCFGCHRSEMVTSTGGRGVTQFRDGDRNLHALHVNREKGRTCRACHEVHASRNPFHIRDAVPFGSENWMLEINFAKSDTGGTCAPACHKPATYSRGDDLRLPTTRGGSTPPGGTAP